MEMVDVTLEHLGSVFVNFWNWDNNQSVLLTNVVQGNMVSGAPNGCEFVYTGTSGNSSTGILDTVMVGNFFASDGSIGSIGISNATGESESELLAESLDQWQGFWS